MLLSPPSTSTARSGWIRPTLSSMARPTCARILLNASPGVSDATASESSCISTLIPSSMRRSGSPRPCATKRCSASRIAAGARSNRPPEIEPSRMGTATWTRVGPLTPSRGAARRGPGPPQWPGRSRRRRDGSRPGPAHVPVRISGPQGGSLLQRQAGRHVPVERVVGRGLVGDDVGAEPPAEQLGMGGRCVAEEAHRHGLTGVASLLHPSHRLVQVLRGTVQVPGLHPALDPLGIDLDNQRGPAVHRHRQWLSPAHAPEARRERDPPPERAVETLGAQLRQRLVRALQDPLGPDVDPRPRGHLPVHRQALPLEVAEGVPVRPPRHEHRVRDQDPWRQLVRAEHPHRLARLDQEGLVVLERPQRADDGVEGLPAASGPAGPAVHDQILGPLGHLGVEVVHQHPERGLLWPAPARSLPAPGGPDLPHRSGPTALAAVSARAPVRTRSSAAAMSTETSRSPSRNGTRSRKASSAAPVPAAGAGSRRSSDWAATTASMVTTVRTCSSRARSFSPESHPMLTWSSWLPEVGMESMPAGWARTRHSLTNAPCGYCASM